MVGGLHVLVYVVCCSSFVVCRLLLVVCYALCIGFFFVCGVLSGDDCCLLFGGWCVLPVA